jgi:hypothetical protein
MRGRSVASALVVLLLGCAAGSAQAQAWLPRVEISAGGGFIGSRAAEITSRGATDCDPAGKCAAVAGMQDLFDTSHYVWKPSLASGLVFRWRLRYREDDPAPDDVFGLGVGGQMIFASVPEGTRLLPAVTVHAGTKSQQLFFGFAFGTTDKVAFPGDASHIRVAGGASTDFVLPHATKRPIYFVGIVIDGVAITKGTNEPEAKPKG